MNLIKRINKSISVLYIENRKKQLFEVIIDTKNVKRILDTGLTWSVGWNVIKGKNYQGNYYVKASKYLGIVNGKPKYKSIYLHRFILGLEDRHSLVDHENRNTLDNREENLNDSTFKKNLLNRRGANINSTSGERNVSWIDRTQEWRVQLQINGKNKVFGNFQRLEDAIEHAEKMREKFYGEKYECRKANGNS